MPSAVQAGIMNKVQQMKITIIGTDPPCPRCDKLRATVEELIRKTCPDIELEKIVWNSAEASSLLEAYGKRPVTAKEVSDETGTRIDSRELLRIMMLKCDEAGENASPSDLWTPALDEFFSPLSRAAEVTDMMMTPILLINGKPVAQGYAPPAEMILRLMNENW